MGKAVFVQHQQQKHYGTVSSEAFWDTFVLVDPWSIFVTCGYQRYNKESNM